MALISQTAADALIEKIDKAILKHSVSNRDVAAVLGFLNYILKSGESDKFLRKDIEDAAAGLIHFLDGIDVKGRTQIEDLETSGNSTFAGSLSSDKFISGFPEGSGWGLFVREFLNAAGVSEKRTSLEVDDLTVRKQFRVYEMIISQLLGENGTRLTTDMMKVESALPEDKKILLDTEKGVLYNPFRSGDILMVQRAGTAGIPGKEYEFVVTDVGCGSIDDKEERIDWLTYEKFTGDEANIAPGDTLVRVDSLTNPDRTGLIKHTSIEPHSPYIDIITNMKTRPADCVRSRFGRLDGLVTDLFGQLEGFGLYCDNIYACGKFRLETGEDVRTKFEILEGQFLSEIHALRDEFSQEDNFLRNSGFSSNMNYWEHHTEIITYKYGTAPLFLNQNLYAEKRQVAELVNYDGRLVLRIKNSYIKQYNKDLFQPEEGRTLYLTVRYLCKKAGTASFGFEGKELFIEETFKETTEYVERVISAPWDGTGDFIFRFTGDLYISLLVLAYNELQDFIVDATTRFEQTDKAISLLAESYHTLHGAFVEHKASFHVTSEAIESIVERITTSENEIDGLDKTITTAGWITVADGNRLWATIETVNNIGNLVTEHESQFEVVARQISATVQSIGENAAGIQELKSAGFITQADGNSFWASKELADGKKIISYINQAPDDVTIDAEKIHLLGAVSFDCFDSTIISGGKIKTDLLDVDSILARQAKIGDFSIQNGSIFSETNAYGYTNSRFFMYAHGDGFIGFSSKNAWVGIGLNTLPASTGGQALGRFESTENDAWGMKLGLYINVGNSTYGRNFGIHSIQSCICNEAFLSLGVKKVYLFDGSGYSMDLGKYNTFVFSSSKSYNILLPRKSSILNTFYLNAFPANWGFRFTIILDKGCARQWIKAPEDNSIPILNRNADVISDIEMAAGDTIELLYFENYYRLVQHHN